jgi:chromosome partitioning protein
MSKPHIIVLGNEKGGSGKSTAAIHLCVGLMLQDYKVGTIDLDMRQGTLSRYIENRRAGGLAAPAHMGVPRSSEAEESARLIDAIGVLSNKADVIVIDTPGTDTYLSRLGHSYADTLVTPINDSFIDLDLLAKVDPNTHAIIGPSIYSEMVWNQRKQRMMRDRGSIDWIVMRNRLAHLEARNKRDIAGILEKLSKRIGFRLIHGFGERVVFRELFLKGLTLLDTQHPEAQRSGFTISQVAARQEVRALVSTVIEGMAAAKASAYVPTFSAPKTLTEEDLPTPPPPVQPAFSAAPEPKLL